MTGNSITLSGSPSTNIHMAITSAINTIHMAITSAINNN